ncbi:MAG TPA: HAD family hydrolase [Candidatus Acidoferrales bacterium]|nr:HAD family hydrolase [Candidatus Acidoferrales bacterium]
MNSSVTKENGEQISEIILCSGILFDMDGVLLDSTPAVARVWHRWAIEHGFDPEEVVRAAHGRPSVTTIREYLPDSDYVSENREVERREIADLDGVVPLPGAVELLQALPRDRWVIVTSCTRPLAEVRVRAGGLPWPKVLVTSDDVKNGKPAPDPYLRAAELLGLAPTNCLVIEDAPAGVQAGKAAGCRVIAFSTTMPEIELRRAGADWLAKDCSAISLRNRAVRDSPISLSLQQEKRDADLNR